MTDAEPSANTQMKNNELSFFFSEVRQKQFSQVQIRVMQKILSECPKTVVFPANRFNRDNPINLSQKQNSVQSNQQNKRAIQNVEGVVQSEVQ